jgi:Ca-activated chloride channel family protein
MSGYRHHVEPIVAIPAVLLLMGAVFLVYFVARWTKLQRLRRRYGAAAPRHVAIRWGRVLPALLMLGAVAFLVLAFAGFSVTRQVTSGSVVLAIDVSRSMQAKDVRPTRLDAARAAAKAFVDQVPEDFRIGVVTFADAATVVIQPTTDRTQVSDALDGLTPATSTGTVIGDGLGAADGAIAADRQANGDQPAAVVLLSDGRDSGSQQDPATVADQAASENILVSTVAIGRPDTGGSSANLLQQMAEATGGQYLTADSADQLTQVYETLGSNLTYDLAIGGSGTLYLILAVILALLSGWALLTLSR